MNIIAQCCALSILLIIFYFFVTHRWLKVNTSMAYFVLLVSAIICVSLDIFSVYVIMKADQFQTWFVSFICKIYPVSMASLTCCALMYAYADVYKNKVVRRRKNKIAVCVMCVCNIIILIAPIEWHVNGRYVYTDGLSTIIAYSISFLYIFTTLYVIMKKGDLMNAKRKTAVIVWMCLWIGAAGTQLFIKELLIISFGGVLGILVVYIMLENPETCVDKRTGLYNYSAFMMYIRQKYWDKEKFSMYLILIDETVVVRRKDSSKLKRRQLIDEFIHYLDNLPGVTVFSDSDERIYLVFDDKQSAIDGKALIDTKISVDWNKSYNKYVNAKWYFVPDTSFTNDADVFMNTIRYAIQNTRDDYRKSVVEINEETFDRMVQDIMIDSLISDAINNDRVEVYYQPIYSTVKGYFSAAEALVRLRDHKGEVIPPGRFIDIAENNGSIVQLGAIVFEKVCKFISSKEFEETKLSYIEINLSVIQCGYKHLASDYIGIMKKYNINPANINLEITESASITGKEILMRNMERLIDYGVVFSLDDFGTGQSNLNYIAQMPVQIVKFDREMTNSYFESEKAKYVMDAAMGMINGMGLEIVSEGIETEEQYKIMEGLGIDYIQGYYFSKPVPKDEFVEFLKKNNVSV